MSNLIRKSVISFGALAAALVFIVIAVIISVSNVTKADDGKPTEKGRLVTIHDRSIEKVVVSQSDTIGDAIKEAGIVIGDNDIVEPAVTQKLIASDYQVNIYRARPVIVIDGNTRIKITTPYQTAAQIAESVGIKLYDEDIATIDRADNVLADGLGLKLTIDRATPFNFTLYGKTQVVRTHGKTVGEMLTEKGIKLESNDKVSVSLDTKLTSDLEVRVWREGKQTITVDEEIAFEIDKVEDADQPVSYRLVKTAGELGSRSVSYEVTIQDGAEVARTEIASMTTKQPKKQVEVVGVRGQYTTPSENENITWDYLIGQGFSRVQAAGIMGNLMQEHRFRTDGDGLAQWTGGRKARLYSRPFPDNIYTQLDFLMEELNGGYSYVQNNLKSTDSLTNAVQIFQNQFERCGICMEGQRIDYARDILASH